MAPQTASAAKPRRSIKNPVLKAQVIAKFAQGKDKTSIAKDLKMARNTVRSIIKEADLERHIAIGQQLSATLIPQAIRVAEVRLSQNSENMAIKVLENTIWPLDRKGGKNGDAGLTLAIQNLLMGPTQVNVAPATDSTTISASESRDNDKPHDNSNDNNKP